MLEGGLDTASLGASEKTVCLLAPEARPLISPPLAMRLGAMAGW